MKNDSGQELEVDILVAGGFDRQELHLRLSAQEPIDQVQRTFWGELLTKISKVINHGGLCGANSDPISSVMLVTPVQGASSFELVYQIRVGAIDSGAWRVIVGVFVSASQRMFPLHRLGLVSCHPTQIAAIDTGQAFAIPYPSYRSSIPFELELSDEGDPSHRLIQLQFVNKPELSSVQELLDTLLSWEACLWGGFPPESDPPLYNGASKVEAFVADPFTIELVVRDYYGSDAAFNCIISVAVWFHLQRSQVRKVVIE